jgi:hypothetical protein
MSDVCEIRQAGRASARTRERGIARLADRQHGVIARSQLAALGFGRGAINHRVNTGRLHRLHVGVYAVGHARVSRYGRWMAAVLACGPTALLSHRSAASLWGILPPTPYPPDVTTAGRCRGRPRIVLHRSRLHPEDGAVSEGIPVTSVARTLLDLAEVVRLRQLARALEDAERRSLFDLGAVERLIARSRGRHGLRALNQGLADYRPPAFTRSGLERRFLDLCRRTGLPRPAANLFIAGWEVDMSWPDHRLVVELDGHDSHRTRAAFERDRRRDTTLQLAGYRVLRITDRRLESEPAEVLAAVRSLLDRV